MTLTTREFRAEPQDLQVLEDSGPYMFVRKSKNQCIQDNFPAASLQGKSHYMLMINDSLSEAERGKVLTWTNFSAKIQLTGERTRMNYITSLLPRYSLGIPIK